VLVSGVLFPEPRDGGRRLDRLARSRRNQGNFRAVTTNAAGHGRGRAVP
jgi:hypothetical protein